ncbi:RNA polymerase sigma-B factor [Spinactinospora alkalitolerans]|uniref:RNA polymerase sigma-B factor n=1 Tax=Spinactinospora alkalitolerans TaxID=687207 RepID=A0A852TSW6_9ACTN|nr:SigB/SigF/SigG family RNA polymerase sigma factor [Spinactinospora alkalitolerans]NYE47109.1 RNA polymerase sigma-B factor [Spinactinospora alkalitolerans]
MLTLDTHTAPRSRASSAPSSGADTAPPVPRPRTSPENLLAALAEMPADAPDAARIRSTLAEIYMPLAHREARRYRSRGEPFDDLYQVAMLGVMKAIKGFDPGYGRPFVSYLLPMVTGELKRHFRDATWAVRVPRKHQEKRTELNRFTIEFTQSRGRAPTTAETAEALGMDTDAAVELIDAATAYSALSLDAPYGDRQEEDTSLGDTLGQADHALESVVDREALQAALAELPARRRRIVLLRFFGNKTQAEIAEALGISQMHVSRLLAQTLDQLHASLMAES